MEQSLKIFIEDVFTGISAGALNPQSREALEHAVRYYGLVRSMKTDCKRIAANTGFREKDIRRIKNHVFYEDTNFMMALWQDLMKVMKWRVHGRYLLKVAKLRNAI